MCGIAGILFFNGQTADTEIVKPMTDALSHRGPDGEGFWATGPVGLGHRRLAIIDLSAAGKQPMSNEAGTVWVTYNGEIYNFAEIRQTLQQSGHCFRSATDTEVIVHAYEEWGINCVNRLNGMFAFALWDDTRGILWLVRDRLGVKPLFYSLRPDRVLFGSEVKAILANAEIHRSLDFEALAYYLALNYVPAPYTLFEQVRQLLPGHYLRIDRSGGVQDVEYWNLQYQEDNYSDEKRAVAEFNALLEDSVRLRLVSDVPFGVFLSGGLDSSSVAHYMSHNLKEPVKTFTIGFDEAVFNELGYARQVASAIRAEAHERIITADIAATLPLIVQHSEEPTADSSMVAVYYLAQVARENVTMVLTGDGADELLAGYETYQAYYAHQLYQLLPRWLRQQVIRTVVEKLPASDSKVSWDFKLRRFVGADDLSAEDAHATRRMIFDARRRAQLLKPVQDRPEARADILNVYRHYFAETNARHPVNRMLYVDTRLYLPNDMLVKVDRMTMAHGLEAREPMLDYRLVEFAATLAPALKLRNLSQKKYILKKSMVGKLPDKVIWRQKAGFNVPNARWIKKDLKPFVLDHLSAGAFQRLSFLDKPAVDEVVRDHFAGQADNSHQIWCLLTLALWHQAFF